MAPLLLKIHVVKANVTKTVQFDKSMTVYDACRCIREKIPEAAELKQPASYGLFLPNDEDLSRGEWLQPGRMLEYYQLKAGHMLEYRTKQRPLRVRTLDGAVRTLLVDDSQPVFEITRAVAARIGLHNSKEFSFTVDDEASQWTLRRHGQHEHDKKLETLRREQHTHDMLNWLDPKKTLREQGLTDETTVITLRKRLFFSDANVNANDPVQLHLLYVQCHEAVLAGTHPVTREESVQLAALQCQVLFGNFEEGRFKKGFLKSTLRDLLPVEYTKDKKIEQLILTEHRKLFGLNELNAKFRYIELCRSLRTYGVSFFAVKEKMPGRNKLRPVLFGISRESVMRLDKKTKTVIKTWPLTTVCSYASTPSSFSLNFGAYAGSVYQVKTSEGEAMVQLLDGYIDLILQTRKATSYQLPEDIQPPIEESYVSPEEPTVLRVTPGGPASGEEGLVVPPPGSPLRTEVKETDESETGLPAVQRILQAAITRTLESVTKSSQLLSTSAELPSLGQNKSSVKWKRATLEVSRHSLRASVTAVLAASASMVAQSCIGPKDADYTALGSAVANIGMGIDGLVESSRLLAALSPGEEDGSRILDASRALADAMRALLNASQPEDGHKGVEQLMVIGVRDVSTRSATLLQMVEAISGEGKTPETVGTLMKSISSAVGILLAEARKLEATCDEPTLRIELATSLKNVESSLQALSLCIVLVSPHADSPLCQERLMEACRTLAGSIEHLCHSTQAVTEEDSALRDLGGAAATVTEALTALLLWVEEASGLRKKEKLEEAYETLLAEAGALQIPTTDMKEILKRAKALVETTKILMQTLKSQADKDDPDSRKRLLNAVRELASATSKMAQLAKGVAASKDKAALGELHKKAEYIVAMATSIVAPSLRQVVLQRLQASSKQTTAAALMLVKSCQTAQGSISNELTQTSVLNQCKLVSEQITLLVQALQTSLQKPEDAQSQLELMNTAEAFMTPTGLLVVAAKKVVPMVGDEAVAVQVGGVAKYTATRLGELRSAIAKAAAFCSSLVIDSAIHTVHHLSKELTENREEAKAGQLHPLPGKSVESYSQELLAASKTIESLKLQLLSAVAEKNSSNAGSSARDMVNNLRVVVEVVCGLAAEAESQEVQDLMFESAANVLKQSEAVMAASKLHLQEDGTAEPQPGLLDAARALSNALRQLLNCLPGQIGFEQALKSLQEATKMLEAKKLPDIGDANYTELESHLTSAASAVIASLDELLAAAKGTPAERQTAAVGRFTQAYQEFLSAGMKLTAACPEKEDQNKVLCYLQNTSAASSKLLLTAKPLSLDPSGGEGQLTTASRSLVNALNKLLKFCSASRLVLKECEAALRDVQAAGTLLENPNEPVSELTYYGCIDTTTENIKVLSDVLEQLSTQVTSGDQVALAHSVLVMGGAVCEVVEAAAQASYLVGVADPTSTAAVLGLVDQGQVARVGHMISVACQALTNPTITQEETLVAGATISKLSNTVCGVCKVAAMKTNSALVRKEFLKSVARVANSTAALLKNIDSLAGEPTDEYQQTCQKATGPLLDAVEELTVFASSAEFACSPGRISKEGRSAQLPVIEGGKAVIRATTSLVTVIRNIVSSAGELQHEGGGEHVLLLQTNVLADALQALLSAIGDNCPGLKECDVALAHLQSFHDQLDQASHNAMQQSLQENASSTLQGFLKQIVEGAGSIGEAIRPAATAAKAQVEMMGKQVTALVHHFPLLVQAAIGAASKVAACHLRHQILDHSITLVESTVNLVTVAKEVRGKPHNYEGHKKVDEGARLLWEAVRELTEVAEGASHKNRLVGGMVGEILRAMSQLEECPEGEENDGTLVEYQTKVLQQCEAIARAAHDMIVKGSTTPDSLAALRRKLTTSYTQLVGGMWGVVATMKDAEDHIGSLYQAVQDLGEALPGLLYFSAAVQVHPEDHDAHSGLAQHASRVKRKVSQVVSVFQTCGVGTHACLMAMAAIRELVGDIDITAALLSTASVLHIPTKEQGESFGQYRDEILKAARAVTEATEGLVQSARGPQDELAEAAGTALETLTTQAELVKRGVQALPAENVEGKLLLLTAVKDVAHALQGVIEASTASSGRDDSHPSTRQLRTSTKRAEAAGSHLLKAVDSVDGECGSGMQVLQDAIDYIDSGIEDFDAQVPWPRKESSYRDLIRSTRNLSLASSKAVAAGRSLHPCDVAVCASMGKSAVSDLLGTGAALAWSAESEEDKDYILRTTRDCASCLKALLEHIHQLIAEPTDERKKQLPQIAQEVTNSIQELVEAAEELREEPGSPMLPADVHLPTAAASIDTAAEQFSALHPPPTAMTDADTTDYNYEILGIVKKTAKACSSLVELAITVHQELVPNQHQRSQLDEEWSHSMLTAAQNLASETSGLCETANMYVQCYTSEEKLTAAAKSVAVSMSQLFYVTLAKVEAESTHNQELQFAATSVKKCTDTLISTANQASLQIEDDPYALMQPPIASAGHFHPCLCKQDSEVERIQESMEKTRKMLAKIQLE